MSAHLPNLSLEQLRKRAKELRDFIRVGRPDAVKKVHGVREWASELHPRWAGLSPDATEWAGFTLADAQLVVARSHGFPSWRRLRQHLDTLARYGRSPQRRPAGDADLVDDFLHLACLTFCDTPNAGAGEEADDPRRQAEARALLAAHPRLASATIHTAAAVGDVAAVRALLAADKSLANQVGGPHGWPPLLYLTFSRLNSTEAGHSTLAVARLLLEHGADPNAGYLPDSEPPPRTALSGVFHGERDPLHQPPHQYSLPLARLLLEAGADPNDEHALANACGGYPHEDDSGLALLLEHGLGRPSTGPWPARLEPRIDRRRLYLLPTPVGMVQTELRYSAQWNLPNRVRLLLRRCAEAGIDINAAGTGGGRDPGTAAYPLAMMCGNTEVVDLLTQAGATAPTLDPTQQFVAACLREDRRAAQRLLAVDPGLAKRARNVSGMPEPLHLAIALGRLDAVALLASLGFPIDEDWHGWGPPLHTAALSGNLDIVRFLVEFGADPNSLAPDDESAELIPFDRTPLGWAEYQQHHEVVAYLARRTSAGSG